MTVGVVVLFRDFIAFGLSSASASGLLACLADLPREGRGSLGTNVVSPSGSSCRVVVRLDARFGFGFGSMGGSSKAFSSSSAMLACDEGTSTIPLADRFVLERAARIFLACGTMFSLKSSMSCSFFADEG